MLKCLRLAKELSATGCAYATATVSSSVSADDTHRLTIVDQSAAVQMVPLTDCLPPVPAHLLAEIYIMHVQTVDQLGRYAC